MAEIFRMPSVSPTMETGTIAAWRIPEGQAFSSGAVIAEIGTDKATMEAEIFDDGVMLRHLAPEGDEIPLNAPMAIIGKAGEDFAELEASARAELASLRSGAPAVPAPDAPVAATAAPAAAPAPTPDALPNAAVAAAAAPAAAVSATREWMGRKLRPEFADPPGDLRVGLNGSTGPRVSATPLARKVAELQGVDLRRVQGTGPGGRIVRADVEAAGAAPAPAAPTPAGRPDTTVKITQMRRTIAKRLLASHQDIPTFFLTITLDVSGFVALRESIKASLPDVSVSYNDMLIAAVARALRESPQANASWTDQGIVQHGRVDVGVAVALPEGLITPVLRGADQLRLVRDRIDGARARHEGQGREARARPTTPAAPSRSPTSA
jgi:pyruvate dehydrogenase E2 component (dihydrolipoamide acetyltransferase)